MTKKPHYEYFIRAQWQGRVETPAAIGAKFLNTLHALSTIDPILSNWIIADFPNPSSGDEITDEQNIKVIPLASARSRIAEIIENYVVRDDAREPDPDHGYRAFGTTRRISGPRVASVSVDAGGKYDGGTNFGFGHRFIEPPDLTIVTYPLYKAALLAMRPGARRGPVRRLSGRAPLPCRGWRSCPAWW
jgi:hypothetical protein